jgi:hypothetical protein
MSPPRIDSDHFSPDIAECLRLLAKHGVRYLVGGGEGVIFHGHVRLTGDVDLFFDATDDNAHRLFAALSEFWGGDVPSVARHDELLAPGLILQFGRPPNRIDFIGGLPGTLFEQAWSERVEVRFGSPPNEFPVFYLGLEALIQSKRVAGRPRDLDDIRFLERARATRDSERGRPT